MGVALLPVEGEGKVAINISHCEKLDGYTCFMLILLVRSDLVCRLPGKLHLSLAIWCTPEAIIIPPIGLVLGGNNYIRFQIQIW